MLTFKGDYLYSTGQVLHQVYTEKKQKKFKFVFCADFKEEERKEISFDLQRVS